MNKMLRSAIWYANYGWHVFPVKAGGKVPLTPNGCKDATRDAEKITEWWTRKPNANIGVACGPSGIVVIDLDDDKGGLDAWAELKERLGIDDETVTCLTGGGGMHLYYKALPGIDIPNSASKLGPGIDTRGNGGYVLVPPSITASPYRWEEGYGPHDKKPA